MSIELIMTFSTTLVTFILGILVKKFDIIDSQKIPIQNLLIGLIAGLISFAAGLFDNVLIAILVCFNGAMLAGGVYDLSKTKVKGEDDKLDEIIT